MNMRTIFALAIVATGALATHAYAQETPHYDVVAEYIREMGVTKANNDLAQKELAESRSPSDKLMSAIRNSTRVKLALATNVHALEGMNLKPPFEGLLPNTIELYKQKMEMHERTIAIITAFVGSAKPDVDYGALAAAMPQITAALEYVDQTLFQMTPLIFLLLVDEKPDLQNHMSRLTITKKQGQELVATIDRYFGASLARKDQDLTVSSASVLKTYLTKKGYTFANAN